jgi:uncharacterized iron-regulated membrane protein
MTTTDTNAEPAGAAQKLYRAAWRWHFYAGLVVIPFLTILAVTGMLMLWIAWIDGRDGARTEVTPLEMVQPVSLQAQAALAAIEDGVVKQYIAPRTENVVALFRVDQGDDAIMVAVDPYTATVVETFSRHSGWYDFFDNIHGGLMLGVVGDRMIETAASLCLVIVATGLYMWWPRDGGWRRSFIPTFSKGRSLWKSLHGVVGMWVSIVLVLFLVSGLSWAGIWGGKMVQAWSQFPAEKWANVPLSDKTHASLNHERREVPWALEQTPLPASGSDVGADGVAGFVTIDTVDALAREIGFDARYQMNLPSSDTGVWTLSRDSMSVDSTSPTTDRTVHVDQYTGNVLADVRYTDYSLAGKAMAVGIALHMGTMGLWSVLANTVVCLAVIFLCVSSLVLWWKRRPAKAGRLAAPAMPQEMPLWQGAALVGLGVSMAFPMAGLALLTVLTIDTLILARIPKLRAVFN